MGSTRVDASGSTPPAPVASSPLRAHLPGASVVAGTLQLCRARGTGAWETVPGGAPCGKAAAGPRAGARSPSDPARRRLPHDGEGGDRPVPPREPPRRRGPRRPPGGARRPPGLGSPSRVDAAASLASVVTGRHRLRAWTGVGARRPSPSSLLLAAGILLSPGEGRLRLAGAAPCNSESATSGVQRVDIDLDTPYDLASIFDCEGGDFQVTWTGRVSVNESIRIGPGTRVNVSGDYDNGVSAILEDSEAHASAGTGGAEVVALGDFGPIFYVDNASLSLENLALRNGSTSNSSIMLGSGGGVHAVGSDVTVTGCEFEDMFADTWGAGIYALTSSVEVNNTVFRRCRAGVQAEPGMTEDDVYGAGGGIGVGCASSGPEPDALRSRGAGPLE